MSSTYSADWNGESLQQRFPDKPEVREMSINGFIELEPEDAADHTNSEPAENKESPARMATRGTRTISKKKDKHKQRQKPLSKS